VAISPTQASAICTELRARNTPGVTSACTPGTASDPVTLGLTNLILGGALG
jgi:phospholipid/cholesterol/gamma-HCH transport system substrate-binding protein